MRAAVLAAFDGVDRLRLGALPDPAPAPDELLVRVRAVSVNRALDATVCAGRWPVAPPLPHVPGIDPAGDVVAVGAAARGFAIGDRVAFGSIRCGRCAACTGGNDALCSGARMPGVARAGGMAELVALPARAAFAVPDMVSYADAAYAVRHGGLALHMLGGIEARQRVLVTGATGALGSAAVQIAVALGAQVIALVGSEAKRAAAHALGAQAAVLIDEAPSDIDRAIETTGSEAVWQAAFAALAMGGRLIGSAGAAPVALDLRRLYTRRLSVTGAALGRSSDSAAALALAAEGKLRAPIAARVPLDRFADGFALAADRATVGKVFIEP